MADDNEVPKAKPRTIGTRVVSPVSKKANIEDIFGKFSVNDANQRQSLEWYKAEAKKLSFGLKATEVLRNQQLTNNILPGNMYLFLYDPKHKETLPYYDIVPLVLPFNIVPDGFLGLNLHYLPYGLRINLLEELSKLVYNKRITPNSRIRLSWQIINNTAKLEPAKICVKHYLTDHLRSSFLKINFTDWKTAAMLPVERFKKGKPF